MGKHSDRFSFFLTLFLTLVFLLYAVTALKKNELALFDLFSFDFDSATLRLGDDEYTMDPAVKETLLAGASGARDGGKGYGSIKGALPLMYKAVYASFARAFRRSVWASVKVALSSARAAFATAAIEVAFRSP